MRNKMRPNIVTEAGVQTRLNQWWESTPFLTSAIVIVCSFIYLICLLSGYDSFVEVCFLPSAIIAKFQVYRVYTSIVFHGSILHVMFNMLALVPLGSELERIMGSIRLLYLIILLAITNAIFHIVIALLAAYNPFHGYEYLLNECAIGFSGILFSMIVIETSLSGAQQRSVFGLFNVPARWYAWILLIVFQLLMANVSLLGHLCGILSGFAYTYGIFNFLMPGTSFYTSIESSSWLATCVRRPKFIMCTGGNPLGYIPTHSTEHTTSSNGLLSGNMWRNISSWIPATQPSSQPAQEDNRFPGRGRSLGTNQTHSVPVINSDSGLHTRLLDDTDNSPNHPTDTRATTMGQQTDGRRLAADGTTAVASGPRPHQGLVTSDEEIQKLVSMGFEKTQVEVALAAAEGDLHVAVEILMSQV